MLFQNKLIYNYNNCILKVIFTEYYGGVYNNCISRRLTKVTENTTEKVTD